MKRTFGNFVIDSQPPATPTQTPPPPLAFATLPSALPELVSAGDLTEAHMECAVALVGVVQKVLSLEKTKGTDWIYQVALVDDHIDVERFLIAKVFAGHQDSLPSLDLASPGDLVLFVGGKAVAFNSRVECVGKIRTEQRGTFIGVYAASDLRQIFPQQSRSLPAPWQQRLENLAQWHRQLASAPLPPAPPTLVPALALPPSVDTVLAHTALTSLAHALQSTSLVSVLSHVLRVTHSAQHSIVVLWDGTGATQVNDRLSASWPELGTTLTCVMWPDVVANPPLREGEWVLLTNLRTKAQLSELHTTKTRTQVLRVPWDHVRVSELEKAYSERCRIEGCAVLLPGQLTLVDSDYVSRVPLVADLSHVLEFPYDTYLFRVSARCVGYYPHDMSSLVQPFCLSCGRRLSRDVRGNQSSECAHCSHVGAAQWLAVLQLVLADEDGSHLVVTVHKDSLLFLQEHFPRTKLVDLRDSPPLQSAVLGSLQKLLSSARRQQWLIASYSVRDPSDDTSSRNYQIFHTELRTKGR